MLALWMLLGIGSLWRSSIWRRRGVDLSTLAAELGVDVVPLWLGFRVEKGDVRVDEVGGIFGEKTRVRKGKSRETVDGLLAGEELRARIGARSATTEN